MINKMKIKLSKKYLKKKIKIMMSIKFIWTLTGLFFEFERRFVPQLSFWLIKFLS